MLGETEEVIWTREKLHEFKMAYVEASHSEKEIFHFDGRNYATKFAKYLIQHLQTKFPIENG